MKNIFEIVQKLNKEEKRYFRIYMHRIQGSSDSSRLELMFDLIEKGKCGNDEELNKRIYGKPDKNAYYRLKNRFIEDLEKCLLLMHGKFNERLEIMQQISMAQIYLVKNLYKEAYDLLRKSERTAEKAGHQDILAVIYQEIVKIAFDYPFIDLEEYANKQTSNLKQYAQNLETEQLTKLLTYRLLKANFEVKDKNIGETLNDIRNKLSIRPELLETPKIQFEISNTIRRSLLQKQDFVALEAYLIENLQVFEQKHLFNKDTHQQKIVLIVWLVNTLLRNKKIAALSYYVEQLYNALIAYDKIYYDKYIWTYYQCSVTQYFYSNQPNDALQLLNNLAAQSRSKGVLYYDIFVHANTAVINYCCGHTAKALNSLAPLMTKELYGDMSVELRFRVSILELLLHFENHDYDFLDYKINEVRHAFKQLLKQEEYNREMFLIKLLKKVISLPKPFDHKEVRRLAEQFIEQSPPFLPGSNEFINYNLWLQAKIGKKDYYNVVLQNIAEKEDEEKR